ncbi:MAG: LCP family protein [Hamadaea sp.]|nr:LCP family protein [Hamadaea sp.]
MERSPAAEETAVPEPGDEQQADATILTADRDVATGPAHDAQDSAAADGAAPESPVAPKRKRRWPRIVGITVLVLAVLAGGATAAGWHYLRSVEEKVTRVDAFQGVPDTERPAKPATRAMNILILGSDSREPELEGSRTDTIMLAHVTSDHSAAQIVSIPRDTWVPIPRTASGRGGVNAKINAAFAWGGVPLMVRTVEAFTKVRIDHVIIIDFAGFAQVVDAVGGVDVVIEKDFTSIHPPHRTFTAGRRHLNGEEALDYSRQRKQFANGDFSRIKHQQQVIRAILDKATSAGILADPGKLDSLLTSIAKSISADAGFDLLATAMSLRGMSGGKIRFITNPTSGGGWEGSQSVVYANKPVAASLYAAINDDKGATWQAPK